jgi:STAS-like domain of unknown function (DUF4325)
MTTQINIATDFSRSPAGRFRSDGPYSGERFREEILVPALTKDERVVVNLKGVLGFGSSFLEEAFGGLVRAGIAADVLRRKLTVESELKTYEQRIWKYVADAR